MGIYEDRQSILRLAFDQSNCEKAGPALILIERHLIMHHTEQTTCTKFLSNHVFSTFLRHFSSRTMLEDKISNPNHFHHYNILSCSPVIRSYFVTFSLLVKPVQYYRKVKLITEISWKFLTSTNFHRILNNMISKIQIKNRKVRSATMYLFHAACDSCIIFSFIP